jgi:hypothetical protein
MPVQAKSRLVSPELATINAADSRMRLTQTNVMDPVNICSVGVIAHCEQSEEGAEAREARGARRLFQRLGEALVAGPHLAVPWPALIQGWPRRAEARTSQ